MLHVDDGQLHAYLDGELENIEPGASARLEAHVGECAVCRARLDEAGRLRTAAGAILQAAEPSALRLREFESFQAPPPPRVREVPHHHRALQRRATALAWAASLVVACGIGWVARDLYFEGDISGARREMARLEAPTSPAASRAGADLEAQVEAVRELGPAHAEPVDSPASSALAMDVSITEVRQHSAPAVERRSEPEFATARTQSPPADEGGARSEPAAAPAPAFAPGLVAPAQAGAAVAVARGRVINETGAAVPHAQVAVLALNTGTLTRADGSYSLAIPLAHLRPDEPVDLSVRSYGFASESRSVDLEPGATITADFQLRPEAVALEAVVVTGRSAARAERSRVPERMPVAEAIETHHPARPVAALAPDLAHGRCRIASLRHLRDPELTSFTGIARSDTVPASADDLDASPRAGRGGEKPRQIHGQLIEALRVGGTQAAEVERTLAQSGTREVVLVPWDYDVSCRPSPWQASYRWVPPGQPAFFTVQLRERQHWAEGRPTFDAFPGTSPYAPPSYATTGTAARLTPAQYFELYQALPTWAELGRDPDQATARLRAWEQLNPDLAQRYPAGEILEAIREVVGRLRENS